MIAETDKSIRLVLQAEGMHPAPCARSCEANAYQIQERQLKARIALLESRISSATIAITDKEFHLQYSQDAGKLSTDIADKALARVALLESALSLASADAEFYRMKSTRLENRLINCGHLSDEDHEKARVSIGAINAE
jgi:hypothetical protein